MATSLRYAVLLVLIVLCLCFPLSDKTPAMADTVQKATNVPAAPSSPPPPEPTTAGTEREQPEAAPPATPPASTITVNKDLVLVGAASPTPGETRLALVIGNTSYSGPGVNPLRNPANDANAMSATLQKLGFTVTELLDADRDHLRNQIRIFAHSIAQSGSNVVALLYYSGHGMQVAGENYLVPIGFVAPDDPEDIVDSAYPVKRALDEMQAANARVTIVILDACRDNPYDPNRSLGGKGLAKMEARGVYIAYATADGETASDNPNGPNGLYTQDLLKALQTPGLNIHQVFQAARQSVYADSNENQYPYDYDGLLNDDFYFAGGGTLNAAPAANSPTQAAPETLQPPAEPSTTPAAPAAAPAGVPGTPPIAAPTVPAAPAVVTVTDTMAHLQLTGVPDGAIITVDGIVQAGPHIDVDLGSQATRMVTLGITKDGLQPYTAQVALTRGATSQLPITLTTPDGKVFETKTERSVPMTRANPVDGAEMVLVPEGEFSMGDDSSTDADEKPAHKVYLDAFWIYKKPVTVAQFQAFCTATGHAMPQIPQGESGDYNPILNVTWDDASAYAKWANAALPTEAQWEKAARGTDGREYPWGNTWDPTMCVNSVGGQVGSAGSTAAVGDHPANASPYGALDMAGNVWEWCLDWYSGDGYYANSPDRNPTGPPSGQVRVLRGGSWDVNDPDAFRCAFRNPHHPEDCGVNNVGLRCIVPQGDQSGGNSGGAAKPANGGESPK